ncbi:TatD family hydrolase [Chryseobacterium sp. S0630]|uniref:Qat anti-phage system TatD family nuclease QatD n=1 Tax=Chryseobacterium sp. S0630 TaxID=2957803 RepID=UPI00209F957B|nr:Qat anti-phage system TatD family nuclease QatD [Chryseobacterium sp. S0630]MCP1297613.1 TatD family hydrolase [Chryseobacterium sp. S0630]
MLFDTHLHLDLFEDPQSLIKNIEKRQIYTIAVTNLPKVFFHTKKLCEGYKYVRPALGYHPELVFKFSDQLELFLKYLDETKYIGEIGLDNQKKSVDDFTKQKQIFEKIIFACAEKRDKILTIHSRKAEKEVLSILGNSFPGTIILHWYSGSLRDLETALSYGFYFSINSAMLKSKNGLNIIKNIPDDRLLLESDSPFIGVDKSSKIPYNAESLIQELSALKKCHSEILQRKLHDNFRNILSIKH